VEKGNPTTSASFWTVEEVDDFDDEDMNDFQRLSAGEKLVFGGEMNKGSAAERETAAAMAAVAVKLDVAPAGNELVEDSGGGGKEKGGERMVSHERLCKTCLGFPVTGTRIVCLIALLVMMALVFASLVTNLLPSPPPKGVVESGYSLTAVTTFDANFSQVITQTYITTCMKTPNIHPDLHENTQTHIPTYMKRPKHTVQHAC